MSRNLGDLPEAGDDTYGFETTDAGTQNLSIGAAVAENSSGVAVEGDAADSQKLLGVRPEGEGAGNQEPVTVQGPVVAKVASGLSAGAALTLGSSASSNAGVLVSGGSGDAPPISLSAEGGTYKGSDIPAGAAVVLIR